MALYLAPLGPREHAEETRRVCKWGTREGAVKKCVFLFIVHTSMSGSGGLLVTNVYAAPSCIPDAQPVHDSKARPSVEQTIASSMPTPLA
jgi:hypothetical protein